MDNKFETAGNAEQNNNERTGWEGVAAMANNFQPNAQTTETVTRLETISQPERILTADNNVYREIAKNALKNWNGLTEEDATEKTTNLTEQELEESVGARSSIKSAIYGIYGALAERGIVNGDNRVYDEGFGFDISYYRDHYGTYEEVVRDRDRAALDASRGYTEKFVDREPGEGERRERYWVEVAKQLVGKVGNVSSENE